MNPNLLGRFSERDLSNAMFDRYVCAVCHRKGFGRAVCASLTVLLWARFNPVGSQIRADPGRSIELLRETDIFPVLLVIRITGVSPLKESCRALVANAYSHNERSPGRCRDS